MSRLITLSAALLAFSAFSVGARAQSAAPMPAPPNPAPVVNIGDPGTDGSDSDASSDSASALAKKLQNPIGDLYSFPFQNNTNFNTGPHNGTQDILNIQPVIPIHINADWNIITRTILPLIWQPSFAAGQHRAVRHRPDHVLGVPVAEQPRQRLAVGRRAGDPDPDDQRQDPRLAGLGRRPDRRAGLHEGARGRRHPGQQRVVVRRHLPGAAAQDTTCS